MQNTLPLLNTFYICMCLARVAMIIVKEDNVIHALKYLRRNNKNVTKYSRQT